MKYSRVLLKLSGESLAGNGDTPIDYEVAHYFAQEIKKIIQLGIEVAVVIGGGNIYRGKTAQSKGYNRVHGDLMGMIATIINALAIQEELINANLDAVVMSSLNVDRVTEEINLKKANSLLKEKSVVLFSAGLGEPFFTTDSTASARALQIKADILLKGTRVDGIYSEDPEKNKNAIKFEKISFQEVLKKGLKIMDSTAFTLCEENRMPIIVFNMNQSDNLLKIVRGEDVGSLVS